MILFSISSLKDPGVGANLTINAMAKNNSPGYAMFEDGEAADIFVKDSSGKTLIGEVSYASLRSSVDK